jgi:hypothetical protein
MIAAGLVSDIILDTLARVGLGDANEERAQVEVFNAINAAIEAAPTPETRPIVWVAAHVRKSGEGLPSIDDISGSTQRAGAADVIITSCAYRDEGGNVSHVKVGFPKWREKNAEDRLDPVAFEQSRSSYRLLDAPEPSTKPLPDLIVDLLARERRSMSRNKIATCLGRNKADVGVALKTLKGEKPTRVLWEDGIVGGNACEVFKAILDVDRGDALPLRVDEIEVSHAGKLSQAPRRRLRRPSHERVRTVEEARGW